MSMLDIRIQSDTEPTFKLKPPRPGSGIIPRGLTFVAAVIILAILATILFDIIYHGAGTLSWKFLSQPPSNGMEGGGILTPLVGTVALVLLMVLAVVPMGVITAVFLQEYTRPDSRLTRLIRIAVANLAGVPSIVFGLFGLGFFVGFVGGGIDKLFYGGEGVWGKPAIIWAALTLAFLTLPVVIISTEEALRSVPRELKEASYALGATKLQTLRRVIIPQTMPGILTGAILAISRGAGEVAPIMFTGVAYYMATLPTKPTDEFMHLGYHIYIMATQSPDIEATKPILYGTVLVLLLLTFLLNIVAIMIRSKIRRARIGVG